MSRKLQDYDDMRGGLKILHSHDEYYSAWVQFPFSSFTFLFNEPSPILFLTRATTTIKYTYLLGNLDQRSVLPETQSVKSTLYPDVLKKKTIIVVKQNL